MTAFYRLGLACGVLALLLALLMLAPDVSDDLDDDLATIATLDPEQREVALRHRAAR